MSMDEELKKLAGISAQTQKPLSEIPVKEQRETFSKFSKMVGEIPQIERVEDSLLGLGSEAIRVRTYYPKTPAESFKILHFHPGGYVKGDIDIHDGVSRQLCALFKAPLVSVDYRLAPEYKFPTQLEDAIKAFLWFAQNPDLPEGEMIVIGESSGGNLALSLTLYALEHLSVAPDFLALVYPQVDYTMSSETISQFSKECILTKDSLEFYARMVVPEGVAYDDPYLSPIFNTKLNELPPTCILTAEYDPLLGEAEELVKKLREYNVPVCYKKFPKMAHGFFQMGKIVKEARSAKEYIYECFKKIRNEKQG